MLVFTQPLCVFEQPGLTLADKDTPCSTGTTCGFSRVAAQRPPADRRPTPEHHPRHRRPAHRGHRKSLGTALFVQHAQGYELTPAGEALLKHAEAMENVALLAQEEITQSTAPLGKIRVGVTEGLGIMFSPAA
jgi:hypothetical protein